MQALNPSNLNPKVIIRINSTSPKHLISLWLKERKQEAIKPKFVAEMKPPPYTTATAENLACLIEMATHLSTKKIVRSTQIITI
jgi:hypothetical protein